MTPPNQPPFVVLLVDDRPENLLSLEEILTGEGRSFLRANSGNEALRLALKRDDIGLILLDVQMPDMDGFEVARILKSNPKTREISIIFVTAINKEQQYVMKGFEHGAVDYLSKPLDIDITLAKVAVFEKLHQSQQTLKQAVHELKQVNSQLEQFSYIVAHDIKSPLAGMITILSVLQDDPTIKENKRTSEYVKMLHKSSFNLADMVDSVLEYSRKNISDQITEYVDVHSLISDTAKTLVPPAHIKVDIATIMPRLYTNRQKLQHVFQNLIGNAIKYNDKPQGSIKIGCKEKEDFFEFTVEDNGPGMTDDQLRNMFALFSTGGHESSRDSSTGIGLNLLKMLVTEQGGNIWGESEPGHGVAFHFEWRK